MKKRAVRRIHHRKAHVVRTPAAGQPQYLVLVRSWMFLVMFALMLGMGAVVGSYINTKLSEAGQVAGIQIEKPLRPAR